jgi:outer membrane protein OmpA-like peptidoglycan-associated protein
MRRKNLLVYAAGAALAASQNACITSTDPAVEQARERVESLQEDPVATQYAGARVYEAEQALRAMERAERDDTQRHLAFIVDRRVELARVAAEEARLLARTEALGERRDELRLEARSAEAEGARELAAQRQEALTEADRLAQQRQAQLTEAERLAEERQQRITEMEESARAAQARAEALADELEDVESKRTERGLVLTLSGVLFATARADLQAGQVRSLDRLADLLAEYPEHRIVIEGHTDSAGAAAYNESLSQQRSEAVARYLAGKGVARDRIQARGLGEAFPIASNDMPAGRQQNRRVEIIVENAPARGAGSQGESQGEPSSEGPEGP